MSTRGKQKASGHGSITKAGKVRKQTIPIPKSNLKKKPCPRVSNKKKYYNRFVNKREPGQYYKDKRY